MGFRRFNGCVVSFDTEAEPNSQSENYESNYLIRSYVMDEDFTGVLTWIGFGIGILIVFMILEVVLRTLTNRYSTSQTEYPHRLGTQLPRSAP